MSERIWAEGCKMGWFAEGRSATPRVGYLYARRERRDNVYDPYYRYTRLVLPTFWCKKYIASFFHTQCFLRLAILLLLAAPREIAEMRKKNPLLEYLGRNRSTSNVSLPPSWRTAECGKWPRCHEWCRGHWNYVGKSFGYSRTIDMTLEKIIIMALIIAWDDEGTWLDQLQGINIVYSILDHGINMEKSSFQSLWWIIAREIKLLVH